MRLYLHDYGQTVADVDRSRVLLAWIYQHVRAVALQRSQEGFRVLVCAVFAPQRPEQA